MCLYGNDLLKVAMVGGIVYSHIKTHYVNDYNMFSQNKQ